MINASIKGLNPVTQVTVRTPLFKERMLSLGQAQRNVIIDLGPARSSTLAALHGTRCRVDIINLPELLSHYPFDSDSDALMQALSQRILLSDMEQVELVLCWTLLNYLDPIQLQELMFQLDKRLAPSAKIHALIGSSSTLLPKEPSAVCAEGYEHLLIESKEAPLYPSPGYSSGSLEKNMQGFKSERTMLLSNGMREYIFSRQ
ncbi:MAG: hypothetical protein EA373_12360 [Oceanospirillales bacterium]|nr:MAG: hypothetical protein EA373_12360 [Oceanospirillales bacterium]